jgi:predicted AAA+ superfamily ATPase
MEKELILNEIYRQNLHWKGDDDVFFEKKDYKRKLFFLLLKYLDKRQILSIIGLRRVGKTVLLKQIIEYLINHKIKAKNIFFLSFDDSLVNDVITIDDYISAYLNNFQYDKKEKIYIVIDEIQYAPKWQHIIKKYYDTNFNIKFIISGSSSLFLRKKTTESLAGRIYEFTLNVLSFEEYLELIKINKNILNDYLQAKIDIKRISLESLKNQKNKIQKFLAEYGSEVEKYFEKYISFGHFPELALEEDRGIARKYIRESIYKKTIEYDIPRIFGVNKINKLRFLYDVLIHETGNEIKLNNIAKEIQVSYKTLQSYLEFFSESLLVNIIYNYSKSFRKSKRSIKKVYIASTNFYIMDEKISPQIRNQILGHLSETYAYNLLKNNFEYISIYKERQKEIDFVVSDSLLDNQNFFFIEIKYRNNIVLHNFKFLQATAKKVTQNPYLIFSKNDFKFVQNGAIIPLYLIS